MKKKFWRAALVLMLCVSLAGCSAGNIPASSTAAPSAAPTAGPTAAPTAEPTAAPTATPTAEPTPEPVSEALRAEIDTMHPLLTAHILAQLNGGTFDKDAPEYFWQTVAFAIDGCGMDFYSAETFGSALVLSRGVIEEIASGLFENGGAFLLEIPASLSGEITYDKDADAFSHPLSEGGFSVNITSASMNADGSVKLTGEFYAAAMPTSAITAFTATLVENTRSGNSVFTLSIKELKIG